MSTVGVKKSEKARAIWFDGMTEAIKRLKPSHVIVYGGDLGYEFDCGVTYIANKAVERMQDKKR